MSNSIDGILSRLLRRHDKSIIPDMSKLKGWNQIKPEDSAFLLLKTYGHLNNKACNQLILYILNLNHNAHIHVSATKHLGKEDSYQLIDVKIDCPSNMLKEAQTLARCIDVNVGVLANDTQ